MLSFCVLVSFRDASQAIVAESLSAGFAAWLRHSQHDDQLIHLSGGMAEASRGTCMPLFFAFVVQRDLPRLVASLALNTTILYDTV